MPRIGLLNALQPAILIDYVGTGMVLPPLLRRAGADGCLREIFAAAVVGRSPTVGSERERLDRRRSQFDPHLPLGIFGSTGRCTLVAAVR